jgi:hypothetical protein
MKEEHLEVKRRHGPTTLERLKWHVGSLVAIVLFILLALQIAGLIFKPAASSTTVLRELADASSRVGTNANARTFPVEDRLKQIDGSVGELRTTLKHVVAPKDQAWGITYPPDYLDTLKPGASNEIKFQAPLDVSATAEAGGIDLKWSEGANNNVKVGSFEVLRKEGSAEPASVGKVEGSTHSWRDTTVKPGHLYEYAVVAIAADAGLANTPRGRSPASAPASAKALADFKIELVEAKDGTTIATFKVSKWRDGSWRDRTVDVKEGDAIGEMDQALGVDWSTGRKLAKLTFATAEVPVTRDELVFDAKGRVILEQGLPKRVSVTGTQSKHTVTASITGGELPDDTLTLEK